MTKVGLNGHDRGVNVVARILRDAGTEVAHGGLRQTPATVAVFAAALPASQACTVSLDRGVCPPAVVRHMECTVKISIDFGKCTGHGRCYTLSPSLFTDDERGYGQAKSDGTVAPEQFEDAKRAVRSCPEHAITLED